MPRGGGWGGVGEEREDKREEVTKAKRNGSLGLPHRGPMREHNPQDQQHHLVIQTESVMLGVSFTSPLRFYCHVSCAKRVTRRAMILALTF